MSIYSMNGQDHSAITIEFDNITLKEAILHLERSTDTFFYFEEEWLKNHTVSKKYDQTDLKTILKGILEKTNINFFIKGKKVILLFNNIIYQELPNSLFDEKKTLDNNTPIFQEEYISQATKQSKNLIAIGKQNTNTRNKTFTVSGYVKDSKTNVPIEEVSIFTVNRSIYTTSDSNGFYSIKLSYGFNQLETNLLGYRKTIQDMIVYNDGTFNLKIEENTETLDEVLIESKKGSNVKEVLMGTNQIEAESIKTIPLVLGERDILKVATTLPGIKTVGEGASGFNVRGGRADQNLILLDDAVLYNPSHFLGFFSAVNPFTTKNINIYKASIPIEYGGRLSSVFDIETKSDTPEKLSAEGSIGPITANLAGEIPIVKKKASVIVGVRATYSDYILKNLDEESLKNSEASFYDGIIKYNHKINTNNSLQGTFYYSKDKFSITSDSIFKYNNRLISLKWNRSFSEKSKANLILVNSEYKYEILYKANANLDFDFGYKLNESQAKLNFNYTLNNKHKFSYGLSSKLYTIDPGTIKPVGVNSDIKLQIIEREKGLESAFYFSDLYKATDKLLLEIGFRYSLYAALGKSTQNIYAANQPINENSIIEVKEYGNNEIIKTYGMPEYRISGRYLLGNEFSIKGSYNKTSQYIHLLSTNTTMSPTDIWKLSDRNIRPQQANQYSLGVFKNITNKNLEFSLEGYYKKMNDILDYKIGAELILNKNIETELLQGEGKAYGIEFLFKKTKGKLNGYFGYSYSRALIKLDSEIYQERVNNGKFFSANYDKPHDFSLVANYKLTKRYSISTNFTYQTGRPVTYPVGRYTIAGQEQVVYSDRNQYRIPDYYRLDIGINIEGNHKLKKLGHSFINISVYNVLGRNNPYSVFFVNDDQQIKAYKTSIFSIPIPTITYNFKF
ncbi:TonB-dependent receptor-like protein [Aquimarina sp. MAR_2010_214]|uniref:carboxypeptidase-like regulatory domain-containing protein n=1 Tax=Aquimarina sp. MAR_2010_214 TaxID=1250026 RepID=UPI000CB86606|nr:carboxypeptidase-like regulatory domain-containing protein [Aquimarina sp. MAR_2010_214]PKV49620.1 TonB-dependent receptor-like protein [Aquimarina sp. MAR_2010_214]